MSRSSLQSFCALLVSITVLLSVGSLPSLAAGQCTNAGLNQWDRMYSESAGNRCERALNNKNSSVRQTCSACAAYYKQTVAINQWIDKHPSCAAYLHLKEHRALHGYIAAHKNLCL
jgi:hypothetical protein